MPNLGWKNINRCLPGLFGIRNKTAS